MLGFQRWFLPANFSTLSTGKQIQSKFLAVNTSSTLFWGPGMVTLAFYLGAPIVALIILYGFIVSMTSAFTLKLTGKVRRAGTLFVGGLFIMFVAATTVSHGADFGGLIWIMMLPLLALNALGFRASIITLLSCLGLLLSLKLMPNFGFTVPKEMSDTNNQLFQYLSLLIVTPILWAIGAAHYGLSKSALRKEKELNETKTRFISNVSHELRTPLNGIIGNIEMLKGEVSGKEAVQTIEAVEYSSKHLLGLVNDILSYTENQFKKADTAQAPYRFRDNIDKIISNLRPLAHKKSLSLEVVIDDRVPHLLVGNSKQVDQLLINFVGNAIKFTQKGKVFLKVDCEPLNSDEVRVIVNVKDTGIGISDSDLERLFDAFYQVDASATREYGGSGLGLAICHQIINAMNGEIIVNSQLGEGSEFQFSFLQKIPTSKVSVTQVDSNRQIKRDIAEHLSDIKLEPSDKHLLIVEDNEINQLVLKKMLESRGYNTSIANDGSEAVTALREKNFDLIFMDGHMPVLDGYDATRKIRDELKINTPIIAVTAGVTESDKKKCLDAGMDEILAKPLIAEDVHQLTERWLKRTANQ